MSRMAPISPPRQLWLWSLPSLVVLLSLVWYKRKRNTLRSDPGGTSNHLPESVESELEGLKEEETSSPILIRSESSYKADSSIRSFEGFSAELDQIKPSYAKDIEGSVASPKAAASEELMCSVKASLTEEVPPVTSKSDGKDTPSKITVPTSEKPSDLEHSRSLKQEKLSSEGSKASDILVLAKEATKTSVEQLGEEKAEEAVGLKCQQSDISTSDKMTETKDEVEAPVPASKEAKDDSHKVAVLEDKLASLALGSSEEQRCGAERDSANHSPVDAMLASPSMSSYSDEHSEGSSDSGKGCSDVASPPSRTPVGSGSLAGDAEVDTGVESTSGYSVYDFLLPQLLVGRLIGRHGSFVHEIKTKTNATIWIKNHPDTSKQKICSVEGTPADIDNALAMIRQRFPLRKYPNVTLEQVTLAPATTTFPLVPDFCQLHLVEGVNNEVMISSLVSPAHMFVQQPYHPSYQFLQRLNHMMNSVYGQLETPNLPAPIEAGNICVAPAVDGWYRAQVVSSNEETQTSEIKFVDYGGYMTVNNSVLRQIRQDFMTLPFQATECYLANIKPSGESGEWSLEALRIVEELTRGQMLLAQVYDYAADGVPLIYLYSSVNSQVVLINQELVVRRLADPDSVASSTPSEAASLVVAAAAVAAAAAGELSNTTESADSSAPSSSNDSEGNSKAIEPSSSSAEVTAN